MSTTIPLRCRCGTLRGVAAVVSPESGNRVVCYCDDCQAFARFLEQPGVLDEHGGTDIFQVAPATVRITEGAASLRCVRLTEKGLHRWYADCCRTPLGNTLTARVPFVGVIHTFMDHDAHGRSRDEALGKPIAFIHGRFAVGGVPAHAHRTASLRTMAHFVWQMLRWWARGAGAPSPFFDPATGAPRAKPRVLTAPEREALRSRPA